MKFKRLFSLTLLVIYCIGLINTPIFAKDEDIHVAFDKEYLDYGTNSYSIFGKNSGADAQDVTVIAAVYENDILKKTAWGKKHRIYSGEEFSYRESIDVPEDINLFESCLRLYVWDSANGMKPLAEDLKPQGVKFTYSIDEDAAVSAGVYDNNNRLIRTLWSVEKKSAGTYDGFWDGKDDDGDLLENGTYTVKVMSNNVSYNFDTIIGNNTEWESDDTKFHGGSFIGDMVRVDDKMYYTQPYQEGIKTGAFFRISNPHVSCNTERFGSAAQTNRRVASDGKLIYFGNTEPGGTHSFVYAYDAQTYEPVTFEYGVAASNHWGNKNAYPSAVNLVEHERCNNIGGLDVQKNGDFLFVSYIYTGKVYVLNKTTGQNLTDMDFDSPQALCCDNGSGVYIGYKNESGSMSIGYYTADENGALSLVNTINENFEDIRDLTVSPDGTTLVAADGGGSNQIKAYNIETGERVWTFGSGESYYDDPIVKDDKLLLTVKDSQQNYTFVTYEDEQTLWFGDLGNCRVRKLDLSSGTPVIADTIMYQWSSHNAAVDLNNPTRVFTCLREFEIDYNEPDRKKMWKLKRNWAEMARNINYYDEHLMENMMTLSNGRTYCKILEKGSGEKYLYELCDTSLRNTGIDLTNWELRQDGSIGRYYQLDREKIWSMCELEGFDEENNPQWGEEKELARLPVDDYSPSVMYSRDKCLPITSTGVLAVLTFWIGGDKTYNEKKVMHLGGIDLNGDTNKWMWKTSPQGSKNYNGDFPEDGVFEAGNGVRGTASNVKTIDRNVIYHYYGEFYKQGQTDKFYHYYDNGLLVGVFGNAVRQRVNYGESVNTGNVAGNGFDFYFVPVEGSTDEMYLYQNDESHKGGIWRWIVKGLDSIKEQSIEVKLDLKLRHGLVWEYMPTENYDNCAVTKSGVSTSFNTAVETNTDEDFLLRYEGYFRMPENAESFRVVSSKCNIKIKLDNSEIANKSGAYYAAIPSELEAGKMYFMEIECRKNQDSYTAPKLYIKYKNNSRAYAIDEFLYRENDAYDGKGIQKYDLLEGLPFDSTLPDELCGWTTTQGVHKWTGNKTNVVNDGYDEPRDLSIRTYLYDNSSGYEQFRETFRTLPQPQEGLKKWTLNSTISAVSGWVNSGQLGDESKSLGMHFDIADESGKTISRFFWGRGKTTGINNPDNNWSYANGERLFQGDTRGDGIYIIRTYYHEFSTPSPLVISGSDDGITFSYYGETKTLPVFEDGADWTKPAKIRVSQFTGGLCGQPLLFEMNFSSLEYVLEYEDAHTEDTEEYDVDNLRAEADTYGYDGSYTDYVWNRGNKYGTLGWTSELTQDIILTAGIGETVTSPEDAMKSDRYHCTPADAVEWNGFLFVLCNDKGRQLTDVNGKKIFADRWKYLDDDAVLASKQDDGTYYLVNLDGTYITDSSGNMQAAENFVPITTPDQIPQKNYSWIEIYDITGGKKEHIADWDLSSDMDINGTKQGMDYLAVGLDVTDDYIYCYLNLCGLDAYWIDNGRNGGVAVFENNLDRTVKAPYPVPKRIEPQSVLDSTAKCNVFSRTGIKSIQTTSQEADFRHFLINNSLLTMNTCRALLDDRNLYVGITDIVSVTQKSLTTVNKCIAEYLGIGEWTASAIEYNTDKFPMAKSWVKPTITDFQVLGNMAYAVIKYNTSDNSSYSMFLSYNISDPYSPKETARYIYQNSHEITNMVLKAEGNYLYASQRFWRHFAGNDETDFAEPHILIFDISDRTAIELVNDIGLRNFDDNKAADNNGQSYHYGATSLTVLGDYLYAVALCGKGQNSALSMIFKLSPGKSEVLESKAVRNQILFQPKMCTVKYGGRVFLPTAASASKNMILIPRVTVLDMRNDFTGR